MRLALVALALGGTAINFAAYAVPVTVTPTFPSSGWTASGSGVSFSGGDLVMNTAVGSPQGLYMMNAWMYGNFTLTVDVSLSGATDAGVFALAGDGTNIGVHIGNYADFYPYAFGPTGAGGAFNSGVGIPSAFVYRLSRTGETYEADVSTNGGSSWTTLDVVTLASTAPMQVGLNEVNSLGGAAATYSNFSATFDNGVPEPSGLAVAAAVATGRFWRPRMRRAA